MLNAMSDSFWQRPEVVDMFANRDPDHRLVAWLGERHPVGLSVLDIGCAGGRNTVYLAEQGADVYALDRSPAMVARTRQRLEPLLSPTEAERRVYHGPMSDLSMFAERQFDLVVALGIYHVAQSFGEWQQTVAETARVLKTGGEVLVAQFGPGSSPRGRPLTPISDEPHLFTGFNDTDNIVLLTPEELDTEMAHYGFVPVTDTYAVRVDKEDGHHITVNAHYRLSA